LPPRPEPLPPPEVVTGIVSPVTSLVVGASLVGGDEVDTSVDDVGDVDAVDDDVVAPRSSVVDGDGAVVRGDVVAVEPAFVTLLRPLFEPPSADAVVTSTVAVSGTVAAVVVTSSVICGPSTELMLDVALSDGAVSSLRRGSHRAGADDCPS